MSKTPRGLIPDHAIRRMPKPIQEAQARAQAAADAVAEAGKRLQAARRAVDAAPDVDAEAIATAARNGSNKPPTLTAPKREEEMVAAAEARNVLVSDHADAIKALHRTVGIHAKEAVAAQASALEASRLTAVNLAEQLADALEEEAAEAAVAVGLAGADEYIEGGRKDKRLRRLGKLNFTSPRKVASEAQLHSLLPVIREAAESYGKPITETAGQYQEREARERAERPRMPRDMLGGIHVGG